MLLKNIYNEFHFHLDFNRCKEILRQYADADATTEILHQCLFEFDRQVGLALLAWVSHQLYMNSLTH